MLYDAMMARALTSPETVSLGEACDGGLAYLSVDVPMIIDGRWEIHPGETVEFEVFSVGRNNLIWVPVDKSRWTDDDWRRAFP